MRIVLSVLGALFVTTLFASPANAQMEIRKHNLYSITAFQRIKPDNGEKAPNLVVRNLEGDSVCLDDYLGKNLIVIKGSYT